MFFKKESKKKKEYYIVAGIVWDRNGNSYPVIEREAIFSCYARARKFIRNVASRIDENEADIKWFDKERTLEIKYKNGIIENKIIYEREIDV